MKVAVMGAGAVGCYYGGMLARAGCEVCLIGRAGHTDVIRESGLLLETATFTERVPVLAGTDPALVAGADLVLFSVKSTDTESGADLIAGHLGENAVVICMQNGVDNPGRLRARIAQEILPAAVYVAAEMAAPGHVRHHGRGELVLGSSQHATQLVALFAEAGIPAQVSDNVMGVLWAKLVVNCAYNALSAITQLPYGVLVQGVGIEEVMRDVLSECLAVAAAEGVDIPSDPWGSILAIAQSMPTQCSSTAQDLRRGKRSEIDHLNGYVAARGAALGIPTPVNRALHALVRVMGSRG